jgi:hypothetical protein
MASAPPVNMLLADIEYLVEETSWGTWRRFVYPDGSRFAEFTSSRTWGKMPLLHYTYGRCPETGKRITAYGVVAVGRFAHGMIAIGQIATGLVAIGQLALGLVFGLGQLALGTICISQFAVTILLGIGQFAVGHVAIGQVAYGHYVLAQCGWGEHVVDTRAVDPQAQDFFLKLIGK